MKTIKRLQRLTGDFKSDRKDPAHNVTISELRRRMDTIMIRRPAVTTSKPPLSSYGNAIPLKSLIKGEELENDRGKFFLAHDEIHGSHRHGTHRLSEISALDMNTVSILANNASIRHYTYTDGLFLDTETTGLSGGTGTLPFLIGLGWFEGESFIIKQIFVRDFTEECASLTFFLDLAKTKRFLVTFNGKAFDVGLLSTRLIMNRFHTPLSDMPHLDLLHPSRRLFSHRIDNSRLATLEEAILGYHRKGDLPGCEIPQRYFDWLKYRDSRLIADVFEHNRLDVISMVALTIHLSDLLQTCPSMDRIEPRDLISASRLLIDRGKISDAMKTLDFLIYSKDHSVACESRRMLSLIYKRSELWEKAIELWEMMIADNPVNIFATEELAKWYEHKKHDFKKAIHIVNQALIQSQNISGHDRESLMHRLKRLQMLICI
jgi:uncharacterized protein